MDFYEYWIGKNIDLENIWKIFDEGKGYIEKYKSMEVYMLRLKFENSNSQLPLFDQEAVSKTIKSVFHDLKIECLPDRYNSLGPIFLYEINRGSDIWSFLAEISPTIVLSAALLWLKFENKCLDNLEKKMSIAEKLKNLFPHATDVDIQDFIKAWTFIGRNKVINRLYSRGLKGIQISKRPFNGEKEIEFIDITEII